MASLNGKESSKESASSASCGVDVKHLEETKAHEKGSNCDAKTSGKMRGVQNSNYEGFCKIVAVVVVVVAFVFHVLRGTQDGRFPYTCFTFFCSIVIFCNDTSCLVLFTSGQG
jgi:hypothetical protein